jgi:hypothetical protein
MKKKFLVNYNDIISVDNLLAAWCEFVVGKKSKPDVMDFSLNLIDNILQLNGELANRTYRTAVTRVFTSPIRSCGASTKPVSAIA